MLDFETSSGETADCMQLNIPHLCWLLNIYSPDLIHHSRLEDDVHPLL